MSGDNLILGISDLANLGWAAQHKAALRVKGLWIVENNVCAFAKKVMQGPLKQIQEAFLQVDMDKYTHKPGFTGKLQAEFKAAFGMTVTEALLGGQLMPHDRACNIGKFTAKSMAFKFSNEKAPTCQIGTGFDVPEIGEGYKCTWIKFFALGKANELFVVKGIEKHIQALADSIRSMVDNLRQVLVLCGEKNKKAAEKLLAETQKAWNTAFKEEAARDRHHIIYDALLGQYPAEADEDGFEPITASTQPLSLVSPDTAVPILEGVYAVSESELAESLKATHLWDGTAGGAKVTSPNHRTEHVGTVESGVTSGRRSSLVETNEDDLFVHHYGAERVAAKQSAKYEATSATHAGESHTTEKAASKHDPNIKITHFKTSASNNKSGHASGHDHGSDVSDALVHKAGGLTELQKRLAADKQVLDAAGVKIGARHGGVIEGAPAPAEAAPAPAEAAPAPAEAAPAPAEAAEAAPAEE